MIWSAAEEEGKVRSYFRKGGEGVWLSVLRSVVKIRGICYSKEIHGLVSACGWILPFTKIKRVPILRNKIKNRYSVKNT